jgi:hypothetical protein
LEPPSHFPQAARPIFLGVPLSSFRMLILGEGIVNLAT